MTVNKSMVATWVVIAVVSAVAVAVTMHYLKGTKVGPLLETGT
jgi:hypothetical protein